MGDLFANPAASQAMLDDAGFDVESWLASEIAVEFARAEGHAFVNGSGTNQPKGFLQAATSTAADAVRAFGPLHYLASGAAGAFPARDPPERLAALFTKLRPSHPRGRVWVTHATPQPTLHNRKNTERATILH